MRVEHTGAESLPRCLFLYPFAVKFRALPVRCTNFGEMNQDLEAQLCPLDSWQFS